MPAFTRIPGSRPFVSVEGPVHVTSGTPGTTASAITGVTNTSATLAFHPVPPAQPFALSQQAPSVRPLQGGTLASSDASARRGEGFFAGFVSSVSAGNAGPHPVTDSTSIPQTVPLPGEPQFYRAPQSGAQQPAAVSTSARLLPQSFGRAETQYADRCATPPEKRSQPDDRSGEQASDQNIENFRRNGISTVIDAQDIARRWLEISRKKRADNSFLRMKNKGSLLRDGFLAEATSMTGFSGEVFYFASSLIFNLPDIFGSERDIKEQALKNKNSLLAIKFNKQEIDFIEKFIRQDFYLSHATNANIENINRDINIYSRKILQDRKITFNESNSNFEDVNGLGNDDYVFFSLEIDPALKKQKSRFGNTVYKVSASNGAFKYASLSLVDQLTLEFPEPKISGLSSKGKSELAERSSLKREEVFFHGIENSILCLAKHIAFSTKVLSEQSDRNVILNECNPDKLDRIMNYLFRPEVRIPRMAGIKNLEYFKYRFGDR